MSKKPIIKYTSLDFDRIKQDLVEHAKRYYPQRYNDFNESSFGAMMFDSVAYIGDMLSFYLDYQINESNMETALLYRNIRSKASQKGYNFYSRPSTYGIVDLYVLIPAESTGLGPIIELFPVVKAGSLFTTDSGVVYTLVSDVDFKEESVDKVAAKYDDSAGKTTEYALRMSGLVKSGASYIKEIEVGDYIKFLKLRVGTNGINEIISVHDSHGREYFQVDNLSQEVIYLETTNPNAKNDGVISIMKPFSASRRFVVMQDSDGTYIQFGSGKESDFDTAGVVDPAKTVLKMDGKKYITDRGFDPNILMDTDKMGISPSNTTLTVVYGANNKSNVNVSMGMLSNVENADLEFPYDTTDLYSDSYGALRNSLEVSNPSPIVQDSAVPTTDEIRYRALSVHSSQNRIVTKGDYEAYVYQMPSKFGAVKRACIYNDPSGTNKRMVLYTISESPNGFLKSVNTVTKNNLKTWINKNKMISDLLDIRDAKIINVGFDYEYVIDNRKDRTVVMRRVQAAVISMFMEKLYIGEPISISSIYSKINKIDGVIDTIKITPRLMSSGGYSQNGSLEIDDLLSPDGTYINCPNNCILEIKYLNQDIKGFAV